MKPPVRLLFLPLFFAAVCAFAQPAGEAVPAGKTPGTTLQSRLYDAAGALGNEGFKLRDGVWSGTIDGNKAQRFAVNLFAGNQYWFCATISGSGEMPDLVLRDPSGAKMEIVPYEGGASVAAAGVTAPVTGRYILELRGSAAGSRDFCLLYLFK